jgi:hypothetical protein
MLSQLEALALLVSSCPSMMNKCTGLLRGGPTLVYTSEGKSSFIIRILFPSDADIIASELAPTQPWVG